jgi:hypothetical protein
MLQEAAAAGNNEHKEESFAKPKAVVDGTASSSAAAAAAAAAAAITETAATPRRVREWSVGDVCAFFTDQKLGEYNAAIAENEVDGRMLQDLLAEDGIGELGIKSKIHLLRIKRGLEKAEDRSEDNCGNAVVRLLCFASGHITYCHAFGRSVVQLLTFGTSKYKRAYVRTSCPQPHEDDKVLAAVRTIVMAWARRHGVADGAATAFLVALKAEWKLNEPIGNMAQKVWTSANALNGCEFCSIFNALLRDDERLDDELAAHAATLAQALNSNVVTRGLGGTKPWPGGPAAGPDHNSTEKDACWRGGGFSDTPETRAFFVGGMVYRTGGFLATSYKKEKAMQFVNRVRL